MGTDSASRAHALPGVVPRVAARRAGPRRPWGAIAIFLGPTLLLYFAFAIYPVLVTFYNSVHSLRMDLGMQYEFVGFAHFLEILTSDEVFWKAAANSLTWGLVAPIVDIPLALWLALVLHARVPFAQHVRVGRRAETIADEAKRLHCDHIVLATARTNSLTRMIESSITNRVLDLTSVPVEVVVGDSVSRLERYGIPLGLGAGLGTLMLLAFD